MKKIIYIIVMALCLTACDATEVKRQEIDVEKEYIYVRDAFHMTVYRFEYDSHKYIFFCTGDGWNGFVHDPDCSCHEQYVNKGKNTQETSDYPDWW